MSDLSEMFSELEACCLHQPTWKPDDVRREIRWEGDRQTGPDSGSIVVVQLKDMSYGLLVQSEDYTGHGCQCSSATFREPTLYKLLAHLDDYELASLVAR